VGGRAKRKKKGIVSRADGIKLLVLVTVVAGVPILGTIFVTNSTSEPDLSELAPIQDHAAGYAILNWSALIQDHPPDLAKTKLAIAAGTDVQALGYMLDGDRPISKGEWVKEFVLLPEAGNLLHPAHRIRDQMIVIHLEDGKPIQFSPRALTWVWGSFAVVSEPAVRGKTLYTLERARAQPADSVDIQRYFK
jgi:hypothetical protein